MLQVEICSRLEKTEHLDVEQQFAECIQELADTPVNREILSTIDKGTYWSPQEFVDRFGIRRPISDCSTSAKAVFLAANTDQTVDLVGCGNNARDYILTHLTEGSVILYESAFPINCPEPTPIDVRFGNYHFSLTNRISWYWRHEFPGRPDLTYFDREVQGVEVIDWRQPWDEDEAEDMVVNILLMLWAHPEAASDLELIQALEAYAEAPDLDWKVVWEYLVESGVCFRPPTEETPQILRQCLSKIREQDSPRIICR